MTLILGASDNEKVWIAGDSYSTFTEGTRFRTEPKILRVGGALLGCAGRMRLGNLARQALRDNYEAPDEDGTAKYAPTCESLCEWIHQAFTEGEEKERTENYDDARWNFEALYGLHGELWWIGGDLEFTKVVGPTPRIVAVGSAAEYAMGVFTGLSADDAQNGKIESRLKRTFTLTEPFSAEVMPPYHIWHTSQ